jgi:2,3-bisphosphoglycerate-independent phosphoglycerate mutase
MDFKVIRELATDTGGTIVMLVMDGLGGLPREPGGRTELETASTPNMDRLAREGSLGLSIPVAPGISPGSGPAHLALFGYDPLTFPLGRGVLEALGIGFALGPTDIAIRGNFCTVNELGVITDRRAGRIPTAKCVELVERLRQISLPGVEVFVEPVRDYRFVLVLRGAGLSAAVEETDPQREGTKPLPAEPKDGTPEAAHTAGLINQWVAAAGALLAGEPQANMLTLRGFASDPALPKFTDTYRLRSACVAVYPMYRGVARLVGMDVIEFPGETPDDTFAAVKGIWGHYDFVFIHVKPADSRGEDGDFDAKVKVIEGVDAALPALLDLKPDVLIVTGDHSTPAVLRMHSWHPVPTLLWASETTRYNEVGMYGETDCARGSLGTFRAADLMPMAMAHARRLTKFGA